VSVSPWDVGNHFPAVTLCCGGSVNFQWSVRHQTHMTIRMQGS